MKLLHLDSSILGEHSVSRLLSREAVDTLLQGQPNAEIRYRDLANESLAHFGGSTLAANGTPAELRTAAQQAEATLSEDVLNELFAADTLVIGAPMYNFSIPTQLKTWIDRISVAGKTFKYGANGPEGLVKGKKVIIVSTAGGQHVGKPSGAGHEDFLLAVLSFIGVTDITVVRAHGLAMGPDAREAALTSARATIATLAGTVAA